MSEYTAEMELVRRVLLRTAALSHEWSRQINEMSIEGLADNLTMVTLCRLYEQESLRPIELQESVALTSGGTSKLLDRLEEAGLVARLSSKPSGDRRGVRVALTKKGRSALLQVLATIAPEARVFTTDLAHITGELGRRDPASSASDHGAG
jgi:DNA-binding MarR family transcriptional regulator